MTLLDGACGFAQFTPERLADVQVRRLAAKVRIEASAALEASHPCRIASRVVVRFSDGATLERFVADPKGTPLNRAMLGDVEAKARQLPAPVATAPEIASFLAVIRGTARSPRIAQLRAAIPAIGREGMRDAPKSGS